MLELPVLVTVTACAADVVPVVTSPKFRLVGATPRVNVAATAEPLRLTELGEVGALLTMERLPADDPAAVGRNTTETVVVCPAFTIKGKETPLTLKTELDTLIWLMLRVAVPVFVIIRACDAEELTISLEKLIAVELN